MFFKKTSDWLDFFPNKPLHRSEINKKIFNLKADLKEFKQNNSPAYLLRYPSKLIVKTWQKLIPFNPNNLGNWSIKNQEEIYGSRLFERKLIRQMTDLYQADVQKIEGYMTSGGTEGNIFSVWLGRKFLEEKIKTGKICLLKNCLSHYSISKAADITNIKTYDVAINPKFWNTDINSLKKTIEKLHQQNYQGFILSLTAGYTLTGTNDNLEEIFHLINTLSQQYPNLKFYTWLDASLSGLSIPFVNEKFRPFANKQLFSLVVDFHKLGGVPFPSGLVLYKKELRQLIEKKIDYLPQKDNTLLGSRSGISPVVSWVLINSLGRSGFKKLIDACLKKKTDFIDKYNKIPDLEFITDKHSIGAGIIIKSNINEHKSYFKKKYDLDFKTVKIKFNNKQEKITMSKLFFLEK